MSGLSDDSFNSAQGLDNSIELRDNLNNSHIIDIEPEMSINGQNSTANPPNDPLPGGSAEENVNDAQGGGLRAGNINSVSIKLPEFWQRAPEVWFMQVEANFALSRINNESTKYMHVLRVLPQDVAIDCTDVIRECSTHATPYTYLKDALLRRNSLTESQRIEGVLNTITMGDGSPSTFYRKLTNIAGTEFSPQIIRKIWARRLPKDIEIVVKSMDGTEINQVLIVADNIWDVVKRNTNINEISKPEKEYDQLTKQIEALTLSINEMKAKANSRPRTRSRSRTPTRKSRNSNDNKSEPCWYHRTFGSKAERCRSPCNYQSEN